VTLLLLTRDASAQNVFSITPTAGPVTGGTTVTITGEGFGAGTTVTFGGVEAVVQNVSSGSLTVTTPAFPLSNTSGALNVPVTVTDAGGEATVADTPFRYDYTFYIAAVSPSSVPVEGGAEVIIRGAGFTSDATVEFGGTAAAVTFVDATELRAQAPAHVAGVVDVVVRIISGTSSATLANGISFGPAVVVGAPGALTRASLTSTGSAPTGSAAGALMSRNGRFVVFSHPDNGVVPGDANNLNDLYILDLDLQTTTQVIINENGSPGP
jgi:hypothetical protein